MTFTDQMNRSIVLDIPPLRIVSLVPSQTELLWHLGLREELVGITKFCIHPEEMFHAKPRVGGTKKINFEKIRGLKPDLIIGNKEENEQVQMEMLMEQYPVWMSDIVNLDQALDMIGRIGVLVNKKKEAAQLLDKIHAGFDAFNAKKKILKPFRTAYFIWRNPYMVAGHTTFITEMMRLCGFENVFAGKESRYPEVNADEIVKADPELILLSSEPYPFKEKHLEEFRQLLPKAKVMVVDGEIFSWYGNRLVHAPEYFHELLLQLSIS